MPTYECEPTLNDTQVIEVCKKGFLMLDGVVPEEINQRTLAYLEEHPTMEPTDILKEDWFHQNVRLMKALTQKGYDVNYSWGMNGHGQKFGGAILPEMMRWLWRDGPVSTDPRDTVERSFRQPAAKRN